MMDVDEAESDQKASLSRPPLPPLDFERLSDKKLQQNRDCAAAGGFTWPAMQTSPHLYATPRTRVLIVDRLHV